MLEKQPIKTAQVSQWLILHQATERDRFLLCANAQRGGDFVVKQLPNKEEWDIINLLTRNPDFACLETT